MLWSRLFVPAFAVLALSCAHKVTLAPSSAATPFYLTSKFLDRNASRIGYDPVTLAGSYSFVRRTFISDQRAYPISAVEHVMQVSSEGYGGEGHAVVTLYRLDEQGMHIDASFGLFSNNASGEFGSSFLLQREYAESSLCLGESCEMSATPSAERVAAYRDGWTGWFGAVPAALARRIVEDPSNATYVRLDPDAYAIRLHELLRRYPAKPLELTRGYVADAFQRDWRDLANVVCLDLHPGYCRGADEGDGTIWPNHELALMFARDHRREEVFELGKLAKLGKATTPKALALTNADVVDDKTGRASYTGHAFVCFTHRTVEWSLLGPGTIVTAYEGELRDGRPHGDGVLFFSASCERARRQPLEERRLRAEFVDGFAEGPAESYSILGRLVMAGPLSHSLPSGTTRFFSELGGERSTAEYAGGALADGAFRYAEPDYYFVKTVPSPVRRVFTGTRTKGVLAGTWAPVLMAVGAPGHQMMLLDNELYMDWEATPGAYATGTVVRDHDQLEYRFRGPGEFHWPNGAILEGTWNQDGSLIVGKARYFDPSAKKWYATTVDANGKFNWTVLVRTRRPWYENVGAELKRWGATGLDQINRAGHGFEHFLCRATGTEEGKNCQVAVGVEYGPGGPVLTDGEGKPSEVVWESKGIDWSAALGWQQTTDMTDLERQMISEALSPFFSPLDISALSRAPAGASLLSLPLVRGTPTTTGKARGCDRGGCGKFLARRRDTSTDARGNKIVTYRVHNGTDYLVKPGEAILAPFDGVVTFVRSDDNHVIKNFVQITSTTGERAEITYVRPLLGPGEIKKDSLVSRGSLIGFAANLHPEYPEAVPNHVHVQYWVPGPKGSRGFWVSPDGKERNELRAP